MAIDSKPPSAAAAQLRKQLLGNRKLRLFGRGGDWWIKSHFQAHAAIAIIVLALIVFTLFREAAGFFPGNRHNLVVYRMAGLEYVDILRRETEDYAVLGRQLAAARQLWRSRLAAQGNGATASTARLSSIDTLADRLDDAIGTQRDILGEMADHATEVKERDRVAQDMQTSRTMLLREAERAAPARAAELRTQAARTVVEPVDFAVEIGALRARLPEIKAANRQLAAVLEEVLSAPLTSNDSAVAKVLNRFNRDLRRFLQSLPQREQAMEQWRQNKPVSWWESFNAFAFGRDWITASFWQDWYGVLPLLFGSFFVSVLALGIAIPLGVCAAIYVNQLARPVEQRLIKPYIEFISAIPSVVLGFFGIAVLGETLRHVSQYSWLTWVPGFPMHERLTAFTAACLLALIAIPTIFTLAEDALNNVPRALREASLALGATPLQTIVHVTLPAALSGIVAAVLLGFGRVVGETMIVLLCAGNRIQIPDLTQGPGAIFQPVHTMTGIIAQEMGEVVRGSLHYRALFMVGCLLFLLSLAVNYGAQKIVRHYRLPQS